MKRLATLLTLAATPAAAVDDPCLIGTWEADASDMAHLMSVQTGASVIALSGRATMEILPSGEMTMLAEDMTFEMAMPDMPKVPVTITGYSRGSMTTDGAAFNTFVSDFDLVGKADIMGSVMEIPVNSGTAPWGSATGIYGCTDTGISFEATALGSIPRSWRRVR